jgi:hypothetical protein
VAKYSLEIKQSAQKELDSLRAEVSRGTGVPIKPGFRLDGVEERRKNKAHGASRGYQAKTIKPRRGDRSAGYGSATHYSIPDESRKFSAPSASSAVKILKNLTAAAL